MAEPSRATALRTLMLLLHIEALRLGVGLAQEVRAQLVDLQDALVQALQKVDPTGTLRPSQQQGHLALLLAEFGPLIQMTYGDLRAQMQEHSLLLAHRHADRLVDGINTLETGTLLTPMQEDAALVIALAQTPFPSAVTGNQPSATAEAWWSRQEDALTQRVADQLTAGVLAGEALSELIRRITGTRALQGKDGLMAQAVRSAEAVAQAQAAMAATQGIEAMARENAAAVHALRHDAILDGSTSEICQARNGNLYDPVTYEPLGDTQEPYLSGCPYHMGCRSMITLVLLDDAITQPPTPATFEAFLAMQSLTQQQRLLGVTAYRRWQAGTLQGRELAQAVVSRPLRLEG